ncbi:MAG: DNA-directed RNA polymerase subunit beta [Chloroflexota bacterium]|nr:DNA-directed RNA polymerase subunit beta [Chloroflexota bacterium]
MIKNHSLTTQKSYGQIPDVQPLPELIEVQLRSYQRFIDVTLRKLFDGTSPISSFNGNVELHLGDYRLGEPEHSEEECRDMDLTYNSPLWVTTRLINRETGEIQESEIFFGDFPRMTASGTFIVNGTERVVVNQLIRSPGMYFEAEGDRTAGIILSQAKLIPDRGAWLEFETYKRGYIKVRVNRKRKIPVTIFLRALAAMDDGRDSELLTEGDDQELWELFEEVDNVPDRSYIEATMGQEPSWKLEEERSIAEEALLDFFRRMRPGDPLTLDNALKYMRNRFFDPRRYDLGEVGRYKINQRLQLDIPLEVRVLTKRDVVELVRHMIRINNGLAGPDDIDHLGNRRVRTVGELLRNKLRWGLLRMERVVRQRMNTRDPEQMTPASLVNIRPFEAAVRDFFGSSQLSQFMEQTNPLAELAHKRTLSALGPGGLHRRRAGFEVRDVHRTHYGRICPLETPEGPNIGLIGRLATYARVNDYGFIETPYRKVKRNVPSTREALMGRTLREDVIAPGDGQIVAEAGARVDGKLAEAIVGLGLDREIAVRPYVTDDIEYLSADEEDRYTIAQVNAELDERGQFAQERVSARRGEDFLFEHIDRIDYMDVSPKQIVGVSASLIPFLAHNDANRALMGANQQRQGVPLLRPEAPSVITGMEEQAALGSGQLVLAQAPGEVISVDGRRIVVRQMDGTERTYTLRKFNRSNQSTCVDQHPSVEKGDWVEKGDVLADSSSTDQGQLALGQNVLVAFLSWKGGNYEDAILVSEELVREDKYTSIHILEHEVEAQDTKLGPEEITQDIPNVGKDALRNLDRNGIIHIGAEVKPDDILVGKITPKGERELITPEEKLLRAIFGEKAREVKNTSLLLPHGERGKVVDIKSFDRSDHPGLPTGVNQVVQVHVAQTRKLIAGDKMAGRHGNKGVVSKVVPIEDMPFLKDGTPVEMILDPLGVPGRMNIGQILEAHLGWAAEQLGFQAVSPVFDGASEDEIAAELARAWLIDQAWREVGRRAWDWLQEMEYDTESLRDDEEARLLYLAHWLEGEGYDRDRFFHDHVYARRSALEEWLQELGYEPEELLVWEGDDRPQDEREAADQRARDLCLRLWLEAQGQDTSDVDSEDLAAAAVSYSERNGEPMPTTGKVTLYDGETGESFDRPVTVGIVNMMKLHHLVEDKIHARSTGPYSLVTQQPLGGKARMGGQRFGEMEVWALEAYGAAHTLQEMLTIKSDDVTGRAQAYEAIVKGGEIREPSLPESFQVLVKELQSLGLSVQAIGDDGKVTRFGKEKQKERVPRLGLGLRAPGFGGT